MRRSQIMSRRYCVIPRAVVVAGDRLVLVRGEPGRYAPSAGRWHLPGGDVAEGESPQHAVRRLVQDRTKLEVEPAGCLDVLARRGPDPTTGRQTPLLHVFFLCNPSSGCPPALLPGGRGPELGIAALEDAASRLSWGWTDLESGLAALRHDVVTPAVVRYLERVRTAPPEGPR